MPRNQSGLSGRGSLGVPKWPLYAPLGHPFLLSPATGGRKQENLAFYTASSFLTWVLSMPRNGEICPEQSQCLGVKLLGSCLTQSRRRGNISFNK